MEKEKMKESSENPAVGYVMFEGGYFIWDSGSKMAIYGKNGLWGRCKSDSVGVRTNDKMKNICNLNCVRIIWQHISGDMLVMKNWDVFDVFDISVTSAMTWWFLWTSMSGSADFFTYSLNVFQNRLLYLAFFLHLSGIWVGGPGHYLPCYRLQLLWENIKVLQSYTGARKPTLFSPPEMFLTTPLKNIRGVVKRCSYFMNCYISVPVGV